MRNAKKIFADKVTYANSLNEEIDASDTIFIATDLDDIVNIPFDKLKNKNVYDGRNCYFNRQEEIKFNYYYVGGSISDK
mgnify:FL=1